jgi:hypothetical protein
LRLGSTIWGDAVVQGLDLYLARECLTRVIALKRFNAFSMMKMLYLFRNRWRDINLKDKCRLFFIRCKRLPKLVVESDESSSLNFSKGVHKWLD